MKKLVILAAFFAAFTLTAKAQFPGGGHFQMPTPEERTEQMAKQLSLTDDQKAKVLELNTQYPDVMMFGAFGGHGGHHPGGGFGNGHRPEGFGNGQPPEGAGNFQMPELSEEQKAMFEQMRKKREEYQSKLGEILTDEQKATLEQGRPHRGQGHGPKDKKDKKDKGGNE